MENFLFKVSVKEIIFLKLFSVLIRFSGCTNNTTNFARGGVSQIRRSR